VVGFFAAQHDLPPVVPEAPLAQPGFFSTCSVVVAVLWQLLLFFFLSLPPKATTDTRLSIITPKTNFFIKINLIANK